VTTVEIQAQTEEQASRVQQHLKSILHLKSHLRSMQSIMVTTEGIGCEMALYKHFEK